MTIDLDELERHLCDKPESWGSVNYDVGMKLIALARKGQRLLALARKEQQHDEPIVNAVTDYYQVRAEAYEQALRKIIEMPCSRRIQIAREALEAAKKE